METIKQILIRRDGNTPEEADSLINEAKDQFNEYLENGDLDLAEEICNEFFSLEPDYLHEFF